MAKPTTRQQLIDYCFRKLGAPVLEINVDDDQVDDLVDDAIQLFNERHFDGVERMYLKYEITQGDIDRGIGADVPGESAINSKISTLTNQNILLEAKLQTIVQDHLDAQKELLAEKLEIQEKYENLLAEIEEEEDGKTSN